MSDLKRPPPSRKSPSVRRPDCWQATDVPGLKSILNCHRYLPHGVRSTTYLRHRRQPQRLPPRRRQLQRLHRHQRLNQRRNRRKNPRKNRLPNQQIVRSQANKPHIKKQGAPRYAHPAFMSIRTVSLPSPVLPRHIFRPRYPVWPEPAGQHGRLEMHISYNISLLPRSVPFRL